MERLTAALSKMHLMLNGVRGGTSVDYSIAAAFVSIVVIFAVTQFAGPAVAG